ncbi:MAG: NHLP family bacteriocin export ABC transporter peptidase/permease/ATPase subunit [Bacteroidales bacterium]|nr:NHLP family bacteriocin export ABC transporter peptidase/permease/ATPase subunit [Bacteroidales bacterium]
MITKETYKKVQTDTVLQMETVECGAASLSMIFGFYGLYKPLEQLRVECGISRNGSNALNLIKAARNNGFEASGLKLEIDQLHTANLPFIVFWNFNHFIVVEGFDKKYFYLNDPATGHRKVSHEEFSKSYTGITLNFKPGDTFSKSGTKPNVASSLRKKMTGLRSSIIFLVICSLFLIIPGIIIPSLSQIFIDDILIKRFDNWFRPLIIGLALLGIIKLVLTYIQQKYLLRLETRVALSLSSNYFWHVLNLPVAFFSQRFAGDINGRIAINNKVAQLLSGDLANSFLSLISMVFFAVILFRYSVILTLVGILFALINISIVRAVSKKRTELNNKLQVEQGKQIGLSVNGLQLIETIKASGTESDFFAKWVDSQSVLINMQQRIGLISQKLDLASPLLNSLNTMVLLGFGSILVIRGELTMGQLIVFQALMGSFTAPVNSLVSLYSKVQDITAGVNRLDDVLNAEIDKAVVLPDQDYGIETAADAKLKGFVELRNVTFGYSPLEKPLIENFNLKLEPGARVALVGSSGSGKSTISKLVSGLYEPWSGEILFDGITRDNIPRPVMNNSLALVDQDIFLFQDSIKENIAMWNHAIPDQHIIKASADAEIHGEISSCPGGYNYQIEEGGKNFSGGQCQRIEIARALAINPSIIILDEATSALDATTEKNIDDNLRRRGCTCIIVAHRLSTIRDCDEIIVLTAGKVAERGTHEELMKLNGAYKRLIQEA